MLKAGSPPRKLWVRGRTPTKTCVLEAISGPKKPKARTLSASKQAQTKGRCFRTRVRGANNQTRRGCGEVIGARDRRVFRCHDYLLGAHCANRGHERITGKPGSLLRSSRGSEPRLVSLVRPSPRKRVFWFRHPTVVPKVKKLGSPQRRPVPSPEPRPSFCFALND